MRINGGCGLAVGGGKQSPFSHPARTCSRLGLFGGIFSRRHHNCFRVSGQHGYSVGCVGVDAAPLPPRWRSSPATASRVCLASPWPSPWSWRCAISTGIRSPVATVVFTVTAGGGTLSDTTVTTNADGRAATTLTLGSRPGPNAVEATIDDLEPVAFTATARAASDFDGDGTVGFGDFLQFAAQFGLSQNDDGYDARFDLDGNGAVGFSDFVIFAGAFGSTTEST